MIKCSKCNSTTNEHDVMGWKCNSCGRAFKVTKTQLHSLLMKKEASPKESFFKCPSCGSSLDDGNENIAWKCSCGNINMGKLKDFGEEEEVTEVIIHKSNLIHCPECGKEISSKAKKCVHCGLIFVEEKPKTKICADCGKEVSENAAECPFCGCPLEEQVLQKVGTAFSDKMAKKNMIKILIPIVAFVFVGLICGTIYNIKVVKPKKIEAQNKATYEDAVELLEKGKYEEGNELLQTIPDYEDVSIILEQVKYESYAYSCVNSLKKYLKNPDSYSPYEILFYESQSEENNIYPICIMHYGAQNGFGGNTTGYAYFTRDNDSEVYELVGTCDSLDEEKYDSDDKDDIYELFICMAINMVRDENEQVGNVDMSRFKSVIKNDAYSTVKVIE